MSFIPYMEVPEGERGGEEEREEWKNGRKAQRKEMTKEDVLNLPHSSSVQEQFQIQLGTKHGNEYTMYTSPDGVTR